MMVDVNTARRGRARRGDGDQLREELLVTAERLLLETGDEEKVSMRALANEVGCTPPAIYMHFDDKESLIFEVCARRFTEFGSFIETAGRQSEDPVESLIARGKAYVEWGTSNPEPYRVIFMTKTQLDPNDYNLSELPGMMAFMQLVEAVAACIEAGRFEEMDAFRAATHIWTAMHGLTSALISHPNFPWPGDVDELADAHVDLLLSGYLRR